MPTQLTIARSNINYAHEYNLSMALSSGSEATPNLNKQSTKKPTQDSRGLEEIQELFADILFDKWVKTINKQSKSHNNLNNTETEIS